ncbi:glycosyltransferase [Chthonobacter rhizosphaerae]|uniref:glycosyltransferase n=1 Tax=Chthonobacter rhizosphaerae TaxID=2735553 RepID=UPI0015EF3322|nr:glycosyltransferase [Chthonobacter rhizosphaerae]
MNILQIGSYLHPDKPGGAEISAQNVAEALEAKGHRIVRLRWQNKKRFELIGNISERCEGDWLASTWRPYTPLETGPLSAKSVFYLMELLAPLSRSDFHRLKQLERVDLAIVHSFRGLGFDLIRQVSALEIPVVIFLHDYALICVNKGMTRNGLACARQCGACRVAGATSRAALNTVAKLTIIGPSRQIVDKTRAALRLPQARYFQIPNPNKYNVTPRVRGQSKYFTIGYVGRLERDKGILQLLEMADRLRQRSEIRLVIAGAGALATEVRQFAQERTWVDYVGYIQPSLIAGVYQELDILAVPSLWPENFSGSLVQALGNGVPALGFDIGGTPEIIHNGRTGYVVPVGDFPAMEDAAVKLMSDRSLLESMSRASIEAFKQYDDAALKSQIVDVIENTARDD